MSDWLNRRMSEPRRLRTCANSSPRHIENTAAIPKNFMLDRARGVVELFGRLAGELYNPINIR